MDPPYPNDFPHSITQHPHLHLHRSSTSQSFRSCSLAVSASHPQIPLSPFSRASGTFVAHASSTNANATGNDLANGGDSSASGNGNGIGIGIGSDGAHHRNVDHDPEAGDVESQVPRRLSSAATNDPYGLSSAYKSEKDLEGLVVRPNMSRKRSAAQGLTSEHRQAKRVARFYRAQNAAIERMLKSVEEHRAEARQEQGEDQLRYRMAIWGSFAANIMLSGLQLYAAISSGSLSLFTTMADAVFDPLSTLTLILSSRAIRHVNPQRFPAGKSRLETCGNIVFCFLMTAVSFIIIAFAASDLAGHSSQSETKAFHLPSVLSVCAAFSTKLALFLYCWSIKDRYSQVGILWQDHRNDLLINGLGILTSVGGSKLKWWLDPAGAVFLSIVVTSLWLRTAFGEFMLLVGVVAPVEVQQLITYTCLTHSPAVRGIDTVRVYHSGPRLIAEVDIVMDPSCTLAESHDVAEALQMKLERLPDVERSFVHVDYETSHSPEHNVKKDI